MGFKMWFILNIVLLILWISSAVMCFVVDTDFWLITLISLTVLIPITIQIKIKQ